MSSENNSDKSKAQGFAGLDALISKVEPPPEKVDAASPMPTARAASDIDSNAHPAPLAPNASDSLGAGPWIAGIVMAVALIALVVPRPDGPAVQVPAPEASTPPVELASPAPPVRESVEQMAPLHVVTEEMPPVGQGLLLTEPQVRWCVFEERRLDAMREFAAGSLEAQEFDRFALRFNDRCVDARYPSSIARAVEQEVTREGRRLQSEGVERLLTVRATSDTRQQPPNDKIVADPQKTAEPPNPPPTAEQQANTADPTPLVEQGAATGPIEIVRAVFGLFNPPQSGRPPFEISSKVPLNPGQSYGWVMLLKTEASTVRWREELVLPARAPMVIGPGTTISPDGLTVTTEKEIAPNGGFIHHAWSVAAGDPSGKHVVRVYLAGQLVRSFEFELE